LSVCILSENMKEELRGCLETKMEGRGLYFLKDSDSFIRSLCDEFCRDCEIEDCGVCSAVKEEMDLFIEDRAGETEN